MNGLINNEWDRDNLKFLLNISDSEYKEWHKQASEDDLMYAQELLDAYSRELHIKSKELLVEAQLAELDSYTEAMKVIIKAKNA
jgi:predicted metal-binding transcription factor (methanogenesis marker protein 9)